MDNFKKTNEKDVDLLNRNKDKRSNDFNMNNSGFSSNDDNRSPNEKPLENIDINKYKDIDGQSMTKLNLGFWFVKNRRYFFIGFISALILISVIFYSKFFYNLYTYIKYSPDERRAIEELSLIGVVSGPQRRAVDLEAGRVSSFFHGNKYDFIATVKNPNANFFSYFQYCFVDSAGEDLSCGGSNLLPGEEKYILNLAVDLERRPSNPRFVFKSTNWERLDIRKYPNWSAYHAERNNFIISDIEFESSGPSNISLRGSNDLSFNIKNNTAYNYWEVPLSIILFSGNNIVGINKYKVSELMSLDERSISLSWPDFIPSVSRVEIIPNLNILDENNYIRYQ